VAGLPVSSRANLPGRWDGREGSGQQHDDFLSIKLSARVADKLRCAGRQQSGAGKSRKLDDELSPVCAACLQLRRRRRRLNGLNEMSGSLPLNGPAE